MVALDCQPQRLFQQGLGGDEIAKTISLPPDLAREAEEKARSEGTTLSALIQEALRTSRKVRLRQELRALQGYWSRTGASGGCSPRKTSSGI
jgi:hypothetical protein